jgi:hypothetical protein
VDGTAGESYRRYAAGHTADRGHVTSLSVFVVSDVIFVVRSAHPDGETTPSVAH